MSKLELGQRHDHAPLEEAGPRVCRTEGCGTILSRHNPAVVCAICSNRIEIGGALITRPRPTIVPPRELVIDPAKPTTDGGVPLPGVVPAKERTYAEMIALRPAKAAPAKPTCPECGAAFPKGHDGVLCRLCQTAARLRLDAVLDETPTAEPAVPEPEPELKSASPSAPKGAASAAEGFTTPVAPEAAQTGAPKPSRKGRRGGSLPRFDYDEAVRLFRESGNYTQVGKLLGVSHQAASAAVKRTLGEAGAAEAARLAKLARKGVRVISRAPGACRKPGCPQLAEQSTVGGRSPRWRNLCPDHLEAERAKARATAADMGLGAAVRGARASAPAPAPASLPSLAELNAELTTLEHELDFVAGELGRLYYRQGAASKRLAEVIGLMAQRARSAA